MQIISTNEAETTAIGRRIGKCLGPGHIVALNGDLGAGKTWLSKGIADGLGVAPHEYVNSPAFDLVHEYTGDIPVFHMDFYRLDHLSGEDELWLAEYLTGQGVCIIEWAAKFIDMLTDAYLEIQMQHHGEHHRKIRILPKGADYLGVTQKLESGLC